MHRGPGLFLFFNEFWMLNVHGSMPFGLTLLQDLESLEDKILKYKSMAMHMVKQRVKLLVEPASEAGFATAIADAEIGKIRGLEGRRVMCLYDVKKCGESITAPHLRQAPFKKDHGGKAIRSLLSSRGNASELNEYDMVCFLDGGKHGA